jgi:hypothetical protein
MTVAPAASDASAFPRSQAPAWERIFLAQALLGRLYSLVAQASGLWSSNPPPLVGGGQGEGE